MTNSNHLEQNYRTIRQRVAEACARTGRDPEGVKIVAVSKTVDAQQVELAIAQGVSCFAENRTALLKERLAAFPHQEWHFIGTIQTNKVKDFAGRVALVHSVASERALRAIQGRMATIAASADSSAPCHPCLHQQVLIEVNVSGEESKDGVEPASLEGLLTVAASMEHIKVEGLMTMAPQNDEAAIRATFRGLRELRDSIAQRFNKADNIHLSQLSMGMSQDYEVAIEEGATIIRIGRALWS